MVVLLPVVSPEVPESSSLPTLLHVTLKKELGTVQEVTTQLIVTDSTAASSVVMFTSQYGGPTQVLRMKMQIYILNKSIGISIATDTLSSIYSTAHG